MDNKLRRIATTLQHIAHIIDAMDESASQRSDYTIDPNAFKFYQSLIFILNHQLRAVLEDLESLFNSQ